MLLDKRVFNLVKGASADQTRPVLEGVLIEEDGTGVVCDGHLLLKFKRTQGIKAADVPKGPSFKGKLKPFILSKEAAVAVLKAIGTEANRFGEDKFAVLDVCKTNKGADAVMAVKAKGIARTITAAKIDGEFPDYKKLFAFKEKPKAEIKFGVKVFDKMLASLATVGVEGFSLRYRRNTLALELVAETRDGTAAVTGLIMPLAPDPKPPTKAQIRKQQAEIKRAAKKRARYVKEQEKIQLRLQKAAAKKAKAAPVAPTAQVEKVKAAVQKMQPARRSLTKKDWSEIAKRAAATRAKRLRTGKKKKAA